MKDRNRSSLVLDTNYRKAMEVIKVQVGPSYTRQIHMGLQMLFKEHEALLRTSGIKVNDLLE